MKNRAYYITAVLFLVVIVILVGCATRYIMVHEVPQSPTFVVIPVGLSEKDVLFVNLVSEALIANGVRVIERPVMLQKYLESEKSGEASGVLWTPGTGLGIAGGGQKGSEKIQELTDPIKMLEVTSADYVFYTQGKGSWVKIIQRATKQVVFVGQFEHRKSEYGESSIFDLSLSSELNKVLKKMGVLK